MRTLFLVVSLSALAGMASAAPVAASRQCALSGSGSVASASQCKIQRVSRQSREPYETPEHHVMSRAEIRAELDALKLGSAPDASQIAVAGNADRGGALTESRER